MSPALPGLSLALPGVLRYAIDAPSYSEGRQECPLGVWYSPEIDASKFTLHILSDTPGGFQWLKCILLMLCNGKCVILCQRVRGSVKAVRAIQDTRVFLTETRVVADVKLHYIQLLQECVGGWVSGGALPNDDLGTELFDVGWVWTRALQAPGCWFWATFNNGLTLENFDNAK